MPSVSLAVYMVGRLLGRRFFTDSLDFASADFVRSQIIRPRNIWFEKAARIPPGAAVFLNRYDPARQRTRNKPWIVRIRKGEGLPLLLLIIEMRDSIVVRLVIKVVIRADVLPDELADGRPPAFFLPRLRLCTDQR